jgi:hypothetical protein
LTATRLQRAPTRFCRRFPGGTWPACFTGIISLYDKDTLSGTFHIINGGAGAPLTSLYFRDTSYQFVIVMMSGEKVSAEKVLVSE